MASYLKCDFKPTPMIFGQEGKNFLESTVHVKKESKHKLAEMEKAYKQFNQAMQRGKNDFIFWTNEDADNHATRLMYYDLMKSRIH